jgi:hypothetical protein
MGPGSRRDTLDDHFGDMNWKKICDLGLYESLLLSLLILTDIQEHPYFAKLQ